MDGRVNNGVDDDDEVEVTGDDGSEFESSRPRWTSGGLVCKTKSCGATGDMVWLRYRNAGQSSASALTSVASAISRWFVTLWRLFEHTR